MDSLPFENGSGPSSRLDLKTLQAAASGRAALEYKRELHAAYLNRGACGQTFASDSFVGSRGLQASPSHSSSTFLSRKSTNGKLKAYWADGTSSRPFWPARHGSQKWSREADSRLARIAAPVLKYPLLAGGTADGQSGRLHSVRSGTISSVLMSD